MGEKRETLDTLLTISDAARIAKVAPVMIYRKVAAGEVPALSFGTATETPVSRH